MLKLIIKLVNTTTPLKHIKNVVAFHTETTRKMNVERKGKSLSEILVALENFAPLSLAESWDNVGLLVDPMENGTIRKILLTNDLTEEVVDEATNAKVGLIVTYHPIIFQGLKTVNSNHWKERVVIKCIKEGIAIFSPHTTWDCVKGGVNDWLVSAFPLETNVAIKNIAEDPQVGAGRMCTLKQSISVKKSVESIKCLINLPFVRLALGKGKTEDSSVKTIALCAGSGISVLKGMKADLYLSGEMLHHDILEATQQGINVILCNHSDSERGFLKYFQPKLQEEILENLVEVLVSQCDRDPLKTV